MRRRPLLLAPGLAALALAALPLAAGTAAAAEPIRIVALYNLTGGMSSLDRPSLNGAELRAEAINAEGGLLGGRRLEIVAIDTKTDQKESATAAKRAVGMEGIAAGLGFNDTTFVLAAGPLFEAAGIPFVTPGATAPELPDMVGPNLFLVPFGDNVQAHAMAGFARGELGLASVAIWTDNGMDYAKGLSRFFQERFAALGGTVALNDRFLTGDKDFSAQVARLQASEGTVGALFVAAGPDEAGPIVRQIREAGIELPILAGDGFDTPLVVEVPGADLADGIYFTTHAYSDLASDAITGFKSGYLRKFGVEPENAFAALGYDAVGMIAAAIARAGSDGHGAVRDALAATKGYEGVTGTISYEGGSRVPLKTVAVMAVRKGKVGLETTVVPKG